MRAAFVSQLIKEARRDPRIMLLTGDLGYRYLEAFREAFPARYINVGVAEANLISVAAGLATCGWKPFVYSIATFMTTRPYEFIRNTISIQNIPVKMVGIGGGLAYSHAGPTHHSLEDIALMRTFSNVAIVAPCSPQETASAVSALVRWKGPAYLRLERNPTQSVATAGAGFVVGKGRVLRKGSAVALIVTGTNIELAMGVAEILLRKNISPTVSAFPTVQPLDVSLMYKLARTHAYIVTIEEHRTDGGLGTSVLECISMSVPAIPNVRVFRCGLSTVHAARSGSYEWLCKQSGFTKEAISRKIIDGIGR